MCQWGTSVWQFTENTYSFDKDVTVTDEYGVVINGGDVFSSMKAMINFDEQYTLDIIVSGDVNMDSIVDEKDINLITNQILSPKELSEIQLILYDVNLDNAIDIMDIINIQNVVNNYEVSANPVVNSISMNYSYDTMVEDIKVLGNAYPKSSRCDDYRSVTIWQRYLCYQSWECRSSKSHINPWRYSCQRAYDMYAGDGSGRIFTI